MIAVDTSLVVALFASWHEAHGSTRKAVPAEAHLPAHVLLESYSILTRLPLAPAGVVHAFLRGRFETKLLTLPPRRHRSLLSSAVVTASPAGSVYGVLIAATVKRAGTTLLTRDRRAARTYEAIGAGFRLL